MVSKFSTLKTKRGGDDVKKRTEGKVAGNDVDETPVVDDGPTKSEDAVAIDEVADAGGRAGAALATTESNDSTDVVCK